MIITWHGEGCFRLQNGDTVVLVDLPQRGSGLSAPRGKANLLIKTIAPWPAFAKDANVDFVIRGAGEYDRAGVAINGFQLIDESAKDFIKSVYTLEWEGISIGLLGAIASVPSAGILNAFEEIDVLIGPAGGAPCIKQEDMAKLIKQLNPKIFITSFYSIKGLKRKAGTLANFLSFFDGEVEKNIEKFVFKKKDIADIKKTKMVCLIP